MDQVWIMEYHEHPIVFANTAAIEKFFLKRGMSVYIISEGINEVQISADCIMFYAKAAKFCA